MADIIKELPEVFEEFGEARRDGRPLPVVADAGVAAAGNHQHGGLNRLVVVEDAEEKRLVRAVLPQSDCLEVHCPVS